MEQPKVKVDLTQAPWVECSEKNKLFESRLLFKKISPLVSPSGKTEFVPIEVIFCTKCGKIPRFYWEKVKDIPEDLKSDCTF